MKLSAFPLHTLRDTPSEAAITSHQLMLRAGMIKRCGLGLYSFLPLGMRVLAKVAAIVRTEINRSGALEISLPMVQPASLWKETGRLEKYGQELLRFNDRNHNLHCLGPTHEEVITKVASELVTHPSQLPLCLYQIQNKFRDEVRPRFGVMRAREFLMKDAYSFHLDQASLDQTYQAMSAAYTRIFERCQLTFSRVEADNGAIGGGSSHEFHVLADTGEDTLASHNGRAYNTELIPGFKLDDPSTHHTPDGTPLTLTKGIEVGHIFKLGTTYSQAMNFSLTVDGTPCHPLMGCYGIGVSRIIAAAIEQHHDHAGIIWKPNLAPFTVAIALINPRKSEAVNKAGQELYQTLQKNNIDCALDDRGLRMGAMLNDLELIGTPVIVIVGEKHLGQDPANSKVECKRRGSDAATLVNLSEAPATIAQMLQP